MGLPSARILVAEDSKVLRDDLCAQLRKMNIYCFEAENGQNALTLLKNLKQDSALPDIVISDVNMPEMSGIQLLAKVREDNELKNIPFIILTANKEELLRMAAACLDVTAYFIKPPDYVKLKDQIDRCLAQTLALKK